MVGARIDVTFAEKVSRRGNFVALATQLSALRRGLALGTKVAADPAWNPSREGPPVPSRSTTSPHQPDIRSTSMPNRNQNNQGHEPRGRGFAGMDPQQQREIASEGGRAAHASGHAHEFTSEEARAAGRKGGEARSQSRNGGSSGTSARGSEQRGART
jgi:general stress protein YciG